MSIFLYVYKNKASLNQTAPSGITQEINIEINNSPVLPVEKENLDKNKIIFEVNNEKYESGISSEVTVYEFMERLQNENKISFTAKNYMGIGKFIEEINGVKSDSDKYWIYYINNVKANIGVSDYKIKKGDVVTWKLEANIY